MSVVMPSDSVLSVIMLSVVMLNVVAPIHLQPRATIIKLFSSI